MTRETHALVSSYFRRKHSGTFKPFPNTPSRTEFFSIMGERDDPGYQSPGIASPKEDSPFVGRQEEINQLQLLWSMVCQGQMKTALMTGGPGLGKSRLCEFFALSVSNRREDNDRKHFPGGVVRRFSCRPETSTSVRGPIVQFFRSFLGINRSLDLSEAIYKVERYLLSMRRPVFSDLSIFLQFLLGDGQWSKELAHFSPGKINELIESLLLNLAIQRSSESPLLLIIEDLHWADSATAALIKKILELHDPIPVFTLVTARSQDVIAKCSLPTFGPGASSSPSFSGR